MTRVLVAEPDAEVRRLLDTIVRTLDWEPVAYEPGCDPADVDVFLLEPTWVDALEWIERLPADRRPPLVVVAVYPQDIRVGALEPLAFLQKPFGVVELQRALRSAVAEPAIAHTT